MAGTVRQGIDSIQPQELVRLAKTGRLRIPPFQRPYQWDRNDVIRLFDSIVRGYPIGSLVFWQRPAAAGRVVIGHLVIEAPSVGNAYWMVDGQQRTISLIGALTATEETVDPRFRIYFDLALGEFISLPRRVHPEGEHLPMRLVLDTAGLNSWLRSRPYLSEAHIAAADRVVAAIRDYAIPMIVITGDDVKIVHEVFNRINTSGKPLTGVEVFRALRVRPDDQKPSDLRALADEIGTFGYGPVSEQVVTRSLQAIRDPQVDRDFREEFKGHEERRRSLATTESALGHVIDFLRDEAHIPHITLVPHVTPCLPVLSRFMAIFGPPKGRVAELLRRWIWRSAVLGFGPQDDTIALRRAASVVHTDAIGSAQRLLQLLPPPTPWAPDLSQTHLGNAQAKLNILGLLSRNPRLLSPNQIAEPIDPVRLLEAGTPLAPILDEYSGLGGGIANRMVHPLGESTALYLILIQFEYDERVLSSHCIDEKAMSLLLTSQWSQFLERRAAITTQVIADHVQSHALFGFRDGPDVTALFDEDGEFD
ncbi:DUF262 domain-containing protein [Thermopolyspora sp. NPDC052614]|uniref:DUF262 domain-containing protein n=1 Tax=Thermopolyspora sp. NPDC052614 TaxID=3155682 RepID=UPI00341F584C